MIESPESVVRNRIGMGYGTLSFVLWGILPLYWKLLQAVPPLEILGHRIFWSFIFMAVALAISGGWKALRETLSHRRKRALMFSCGLLISANWFVYIMAVNTDQVIEASMGYFINPLVIVLLGVIVFKETLSRWQVLAIILAGAGVFIVAVQYGRFPWIALFLAGTFALYALIKKIIGVGPITGLTVETFIIMPAALAYLIHLETGGVGAVGTASPWTVLILAGTGAVTATPLLLFTRGVENTTFSMMGFLQYIAPSLMLFIGVVIFKEPFSLVHFISFCLIWVGLAIFTLTNLGLLREPVRPAKAGQE